MKTLSLMMLWLITITAYAQQPANDNITSPEVLTYQTSWSSSVNAYSTSDATHSTSNPQSSCSINTKDVWFSITTNSNPDHYISFTMIPQSVMTPKMTLWTYDSLASQYVELSCKVGAGNQELMIDYDSIQANQNYYLAVSGGSSNFSLSFDTEYGYDYPEGAIDILLPGADLSNFATYGASFQGVSGACTGTVVNRWFKFQPEGDFLSVTVNPTGDLHAKIALFEDSGDTTATWQSRLTELSCLTAHGSSPKAITKDDLDSLKTYYISVGGNGSGFSLTTSASYDYDYPQGAIDILDPNEDLNNFTTFGATLQGKDGSCNAGVGNRWFKFKPGSNFMSVTVNPTNTLNAKLTLFKDSGDSTQTWNNRLTEITCVSALGMDSRTISEDGLSTDSTYYVSVGGHASQFSLAYSTTPDYDYPEGAINLLDPNTDLNNFSTAQSSIRGKSSSCGALRNRWFLFQPGGEYMQITVTPGSTNMHPQISLFEDLGNSNPDWDLRLREIRCRTGQFDTPINIAYDSLDVNKTYYVSVAGNESDFSMSINSNYDYDYFKGAQTIQHLSSWSSTPTEFTTQNAWNTYPQSNCSGNVSSETNRWFAFQAETSLIDITVAPQGTMNGRVVLWESDGIPVGPQNAGSPVSQLSCATGIGNSPISLTYNTLTAGTWYYVAISGSSSDFGIAVSGGLTPSIWQESNGLVSLKNNGTKIQIGPESLNYGTDYKLSVDGRIMAVGLRITPSENWPDYVFHDDYELQPLDTLKSFIEKNSHLPGIPSAEEIEKSGLDIGKINTLYLKKIEELTLYILQQNEQINLLAEKVKALEKKPIARDENDK